MSGGVDSSVASHLLKSMADESVQVSGLHMMNWNALDEDYDDDENDEPNMISKRGGEIVQSDERERFNATTGSTRRKSRTFCEASERDYSDTQSVARHLSIPLHRVSFASEYWTQVFQPFVESLTPHSPSMDTNTNNKSGSSNEPISMPNPDFSCNTYIKFGAMKDYAIEKMNADYIATGHYAQLWHRGCNFESRVRYSQSSFIEWMKEMSAVLEGQVLEAISGRPEEEWLLSNSDRQHDMHRDVNHRPMLLAGADRSKDQTYFLSGVKTDNFKNVVFPLGHLVKKHTSDKSYACKTTASNSYSVRDIAVKAQIPTASKRDSMGICFIGKRNFGQFISQYMAETPAPGSFVDIDTGEIVGHHEGFTRYTIGQGAKISGANTKYFVCGKGVGDNAKDDSNIIFVCNDTHHPSLYTDELKIDFNSFNWIGLGDENDRDNSFAHIPIPLLRGQTIQLLARTRHLQPLVPCSVSWTKCNSGSSSLGMFSVKFHKPMRAVTPGQILALYAGTGGLICLGGGPIHSRGSSFMERGLDISLSLLHPSGCNDLSLLRHQMG